jgi:chemotaxis signal transduction protein
MSERLDMRAGATGDDERELLLLRAGAHTFAVFADETDGVAEGLRPAPLPNAPRAVVGVVCVRGRMRTLLDPLALVALPKETTYDATDNNADDDETADDANGVDANVGNTSAERAAPRLVVALRGDEQLALAIETIVGVVRVREDELGADKLVAHEHAAQPLRATLEHEGAHVYVLDPARLFDAAVRGTERRRPRAVNGKP